MLNSDFFNSKYLGNITLLFDVVFPIFYDGKD